MVDLLGCQTFYSKDAIGSQLEGVDLKLSTQEVGRELLSGNLITRVEALPHAKLFRFLARVVESCIYNCEGGRLTSGGVIRERLWLVSYHF